MNPPHDATQARCGACQQTVETAHVRPTPALDGTLVLVTCPHCGVVWGVVPGDTEADDAPEAPARGDA